MDRFEAFEEYVTRNINKLIYIPVWIDLKSLSNPATLRFAFYLHSSMDRFEEKYAKDVPPEIMDLHSSMDRFEDVRVLIP